MTDFLSKLAANDASFDAAPAIGGVHPEWKGVGTIKRAALEEYKREGNDTVYVNMQVQTPMGMCFPSIQLTNHPSERSQGWAKGQLANLGHLGKLSEVPGILAGLINRSVEVDITHTDGDGGKVYVNVNLKKLVTPLGGQADNQQFSPFATPGDAATNAELDAAGFPPSPAPAQVPGSPMQAAQAATPPAAANPLPFG